MATNARKGNVDMNYKVIIDSVEGTGTNYEAEGSTIQAALNRAKKEMESDYNRGVASYNYSTYKLDSNAGEWKYLQTFGA